MAKLEIRNVCPNEKGHVTENEIQINNYYLSVFFRELQSERDSS